MGACDPIGWDPLSQWLGYMDTSQYQSHFKRFFMVLEHLICMAVLPNRNAILHEEVTLCKNFVFIYLFCIKVPQAFGIWIIFSQIEGCMQWWTVDKLATVRQKLAWNWSNERVCQLKLNILVIWFVDCCARLDHRFVMLL